MPKMSNWVCVRNNKNVKRVRRTEAEVLVQSGWEYCPRSVWKKEVRDVNKAEEKAKTEKKQPRKRKGNPKGKASKKKTEKKTD
jgi:hypothetical protein